MAEQNLLSALLGTDARATNGTHTWHDEGACAPEQAEIGVTDRPLFVVARRSTHRNAILADQFGR